MPGSHVDVFESQPFAAVAKSVSSGTTTRREPRGKYPLYGSTGQIDRTNRREFDGPSILVARVGANAGFVYSVDGAYGVTDNTLVVRLGDGHSQSFFKQYLELAELNRMVYGSGQPLVTGRILKSLDVPVVERSEQNRIAVALVDTDDLIAALERTISKKRAIKQGLMQELLMGRSRLGGFADSWTLRPLGELLTYEQPGRYLVSSTEYTETGIPVLTAGKTFLLGHTQERDGVYEAVPVVIFDDFTTASKYVTYPFKAKSSAMKMLSAHPGVNLRFVFERMQLIHFVAVDHKRRWIAEYSKIQIATPTTDEQNAIAAVIEDADRELGALGARLVKARAIKRGMMQQLLTGRVRFPVEATS